MNNIQTETSLSALKQYIEKRPEKNSRHKATILVGAERKDYGPGVRFVYVTVEGDIGSVTIEELNTIYCNSTRNTFTTQDSAFSFIRGTLCINTTDELVGKISINIT